MWCIAKGVDGSNGVVGAHKQVAMSFYRSTSLFSMHGGAIPTFVVYKKLDFVMDHCT
jgi:hypothetical protein